MNEYLTAVLFFLPAGLANTTPVFVNRTPVLRDWNTPLDFGKSWHGKRIFGDNKRLRGLIFGTLVGGLTAVVVSNLNADVYIDLQPFWIGSLLGFGALSGDAVESFFKRRRGIDAGKSWFPFDQLDYIIGGLFVVYPFVNLPEHALLTIVLSYFGLHLLVAYSAYLLGLKDKPI
jgi:CDP-2,3-bis-(O-geranylgeranyl)-sn-glycerol synthase